MAEEKIYQPGWEEAKARQKKRERDENYHYHYHSHHTGEDDRFSNSWGGSMKLRDRQAYYGLMFIVLAGMAFGAYKVVMMFVNEWRAMPHDDPTTELNVDELGIRKVQEQDAILFGDSIAQELNVDSIKRSVQIDRRAPYRPPRREDKWYITNREWKAIWKDIKRKRYERKLEKEKEKKK